MVNENMKQSALKQSRDAEFSKGTKDQELSSNTKSAEITMKAQNEQWGKINLANDMIKKNTDTFLKGQDKKHKEFCNSPTLVKNGIAINSQSARNNMQFWIDDNVNRKKEREDMMAQINMEMKQSALHLNKAIQDSQMAEKKALGDAAKKAEKDADAAEKERTIREEKQQAADAKKRKLDMQKKNLEDIRAQENEKIAKKNQDYMMDADDGGGPMMSASKMAGTGMPPKERPQGKFGSSPKGPTGVALALGFGGAGSQARK